MNILSIPVTFLAGMAFLMFIYQLFVFALTKDHSKSNLLFALSCLFVSVYDLLCAALYRSTSIFESIMWQRLQMLILPMLAISFLWFLVDYTSYRKKAILKIFTFICFVLSIVFSLDRSSLTFDINKHSIKSASILGKEILIFEAGLGPFAYLESIMGVFAFIFAFKIGYDFYLMHKDKYGFHMLCALGIWFLGTINDFAVSTGVIPSIYLMEYSFTAIILVMAYSQAHDIIAASTANKTIQDKQNRLNLAMIGADIGMWDWDIRTDLLTVNSLWAEKLGYSPQEVSLSSQEWLKRVHEDDKDKIVSNIELHLAGETEHFTCKYRIREKNGNWLWVSDRAGIVERDPMGKPLRMTGTHLDITDGRKSREALSQSEKKYRLLVENQTDFIVKVDSNGIIEFASPSFCEFIGKQEDDIIGSNYNDYISEDNLNLVKAAREILNTPPHISYLEQQILTNDGPRWVSWANKGIADKNGEILEIISAGRDISEQKLAEVELINAKKSAETANKVKSEFLANMTHELRTPLNAIIGFSEMLKDGLIEGEEKQKAVFNSIYDGGTHLLTLINDILDISKIEAGKMVVVPTVIDIRHELNSTLNLLKGKVFDRNLELNIDISDDVGCLYVDQIKFKQIFHNLLSNAIKFTKDKGKISLRARKLCSANSTKEAPECVLETIVEDTGIGISKSNIEKIFTPFIQLDASSTKKYPGTGLGLSIVKQLVELHNGSIEVQSVKGVGSKFTVRIPYRKEELDLIDEQQF